MATRMYVCESAEHPSNLLLGLNEQRLQGQLCDVTVRVQGHLFKAHTNILASAMGYFRDLFLNPNKHVKKDIIEIPTIVNSIGFSKVLDFIYTSQLCLSQTSVMQVLCTACYLQIPYVVDKCQEFIITHGHVSQQNPIPSLMTDQRYLSSKGSDNPECELINTPPSPGNQSGTNSNHMEVGSNASPVANDEPHDLSPGGGSVKQENIPSLIKQEGSDLYNNVDQPVGETNPASRALIQFSNQSRALTESRNGALKLLLQNGEGPGPQEGDDIDHDSLAVYFSRNNAPANPENPLSLAVYGRSSPSTSTIEQHIYSMTKSISDASQVKDLTSSPTSSVSQYLLSMKKEKPKKEYRCEYCNKLFGRQQHLKRHILTHTGERPYPCTLCDKRFRRSEHLKHHLVKHQQESNLPPGVANNLADFNARKRRKQVPQDAYGMSKMMLVSYNQGKPGEQSPPKSENKQQDLVGSNPILLNKLSAGSALDSISERLAFAAAQRGGDLEPDANHVPYSARVNSPIALNLSNKVPDNENETEQSPVTTTNITHETLSGSPAPEQEENQQNGLDMSASSGNMEANIEDMTNNAADETTNSDDLKRSPKPNEQEQNPANDMSMDSFAKSEVVTSDLKRLFAAMDG